MKPSDCAERKAIEDELQKNNEGTRTLKKEGKSMEGSERQDLRAVFLRRRERLLEELRGHLNGDCKICNPATQNK